MQRGQRAVVEQHAVGLHADLQAAAQGQFGAQVDGHLHQPLPAGQQGFAAVQDDPDRREFLLPAYFADEPHGLDSYVVKPLLGREGANIRIVQRADTILEIPGPYGEEG